MGKVYFEGVDFSDFWEASADKAGATDAQIAEVEGRIGHKLPESYKFLLKQHNGGTTKKNVFPDVDCEMYGGDHVEFSSIIGTGEIEYETENIETDDRESGQLVAVCDGMSGGHDYICLDYSDCGADGEPKVIHIDVECDEITPVAKNFEAFICGLEARNEDDGDEDDDD
jgi:hypothetical protein